MKKLVKKIAVFMAVLLMASACVVPQYSEAATAAPKLNVTKKTITGVGTTYKLTVKNQKAGCKYAWKTSNAKIATVKGSNGSGTVTAVAKGTATITCTITYSTGTKRTLTCPITVKVPSTAVKISNANIVDNVQTIEMGTTYDFNRKLTPSTSSDKTYWSVVPEEYGTIDKNGVFTPAKTGTFQIVATAADSKTKAATSTIKDSIIVNVVEKTSGVSSVALKGADELVITFSTAINPSTVVTDTNQLTSAIVIAVSKDSKGNQAADFGTLTGTLSADQKVLSIKASNTFNGVYTVNISSDVLTKEGKAIDPYVKSESLIDNEPPAYLGSTIDDSGLKTTIKFSEAIDVSKMTVAYTQSASNSSATNAVETAHLTTATNYVLSSDKKSLTIDLSSIVLSNTTKTYTVMLQGIKDIAGNYAQNFISVIVYYDTTPKPQAKVLNITRTAYETITVEFDRSIQPYGYGTLTVNNMPIYSATIDPDNNKLVHFTLPIEVSALSGKQTVSVRDWRAYNVSSSDTTANTPAIREINFSPDTTAPVINSSKLTNANGVYTLTLEYSEPVTIASTKGTVVAKIITSADDIYPSNNINYVATVDKKTVSLVLDSKQMTMSGRYEIAIPAEFVRDVYYNKSAKTTINVTSSATSETILPAPTSITQSTTDASVITIIFNHKLDLATAENKANYTVSDAFVSKVEVETNTATSAIVNLTLVSGSVRYNNANYLVTINGVKGYNNSYNAITNYTQTIALKENVAPKIVSPRLNEFKNAVVLTFDEPVIGVASFDVYLNGALHCKAKDTSAVINTSNNTITIYFNSYVSTSSGLSLIPTADNILKDANGNVAQISPTVYVY